MIYQAMIGSIGYLQTEAKDEDEARANFSIQLHHRGEGLYRRWRDGGMIVSVFKPTKEALKNGHRRTGFGARIAQP